MNQVYICHTFIDVDRPVGGGSGRMVIEKIASLQCVGGATCSRIADSACPFLYWSQCKKGHAKSAFRDSCRTSSAWSEWCVCLGEVRVSLPEVKMSQ